MYLADLQIEHFKVGEYKEDLWNLLKLTHVTLPQESPSFVQECPFHRSLLCTGVSFAQESPWYKNLLTTACCFWFLLFHMYASCRLSIARLRNTKMRETNLSRYESKHIDWEG